MADDNGRPLEADDKAPRYDLGEFRHDDMNDEIPFDTPRRLILSSGDFVRGFQPPEYLIDGILQGACLYSNTGATGSGKTAVALEIARCIASGAPIGGREVEPGQVIYFAGENPDDVRQRWIAMAECVPFDIDKIGVHFLEGVIDLDQLETSLRAEIAAIGGARLIVIDTSAAYFLGEEENNNPAMGAYARRLRRFTSFAGNPTVLANCHPVKNASADNLIPRGGGAFLAEVDGNLSSARADAVVTMHWQGKFRGADFEPLTFETRMVKPKLLKTAKGKSIGTVYAAQLSDGDATERAGASRKREDDLLMFLNSADRPPSIAEMAKAIGCISAEGKPQKSTVSRLLGALKETKLVVKQGDDSHVLTSKGKAAAEAARVSRG